MLFQLIAVFAIPDAEQLVKIMYTAWDYALNEYSVCWFVVTRGERGLLNNTFRLPYAINGYIVACLLF